MSFLALQSNADDVRGPYFGRGALPKRSRNGDSTEATGARLQLTNPPSSTACPVGHKLTAYSSAPLNNHPSQRAHPSEGSDRCRCRELAKALKNLSLLPSAADSYQGFRGPVQELYKSRIDHSKSGAP